MDNLSSHIVLAISPTCAHCGTMLEILTKKIKSGELSRLLIINLNTDTEWANKYQIRSVPWLQIGGFIFEGSMSEAEITRWLQLAPTKDGIESYIKELLQHGQLEKAVYMIRRLPLWIDSVVNMAVDVDLDINIRIGVSAIFESFIGEEILANTIDRLGEMKDHPNPSIRADVAYYLGLSLHASAKPYLISMLQDLNSEVVQIAQESLMEIGA